MMKLLVSVVRDNYASTPGKTTVAIQLDGGAARYRADQQGATAQVTVNWILERDDFNYLMAFYRTATALGSLPFTIDLLLDGADVAEYTAYFVPNGPQLTEQKGLTYFVSATLEVIPQQISAADDNVLLGRNS